MLPCFFSNYSPGLPPILYYNLELVKKNYLKIIVDIQ